MTLTTYAELEQGSDEWLQARCGLLTASTIGKLISKRAPDAATVRCPKCGADAGDPCMSTARKIPAPIKTLHDERTATTASMPPVYTISTSDTAQALMHTLAAERITGHVEYVHPTFDMQRGTEDEPYARDAYANFEGVAVDEVGFMVREEPGFKLGYSPDGLVGDDGLLEIKSRKPHSQIATILRDRVPAYNMAQLMTGLYVTGRKWIDYVSFSAGLPLYVKRVYPDAEWFQAIENTARAFEKTIGGIVTDYNNVTTGLPMTERRPDYEEIRL